ncbi:unnamed protein product [Kuraishia capsulata CBS 1993]|uniref:MICOS complex subunit n=1 Tax=Kuraishia capsulata CBS 1993 TaxID=1382522 RepID=W6MXB1_9ASCO|nr:uncharacterized protein KUCA_T00004563001 [Kuraishia capsulata CBS 1993]CDK28580.1 unnamed protein product [Kuraishia capsulata CBS 1993]
MSFIRSSSKLQFIACGITAGAVSVFPSSPILNDSKRNFYGSDEQIVPVPGTVEEATASQIELLRSGKIVDGVSVRSSTLLEDAFKTVREYSFAYYQAAENALYDATGKYYAAERHVTSSLSLLHNRKEDLYPNSLYILTAALGGSIFARRRNILLRATLPLAFGLVAFKVLLPETFANTARFTLALEKENLPALAENQELLITKADELVKNVENVSQKSVDTLQTYTQKTKRFIGTYTGLDVDQEVSSKKN